MEGSLANFWKYCIMKTNFSLSMKLRILETKILLSKFSWNQKRFPPALCVNINFSRCLARKQEIFEKFWPENIFSKKYHSVNNDYNLLFSAMSIWFSRSPLSVVSACSIFQLKFSISASSWACWYSNWNAKFLGH